MDAAVRETEEASLLCRAYCALVAVGPQHAPPRSAALMRHLLEQIARHPGLSLAYVAGLSAIALACWLEHKALLAARAELARRKALQHPRP
jgi:hypothetical protein